MRSRQDGAAAVEFALVLPILVLLIFGIAAFGLAFFRYQGLQSAAREGARVASLSSTTQGDIRDRVAGALSGVHFDSTPAVSVTPGTCNGRSGERVRVTVTADSVLDIPLFGSQVLTLEGRGEFRCE